MRRLALILAGAVLGLAPAIAEDSTVPAGRYQITPDEDGFVRLDTETGAMSHCVKRAGAWQCEALAEDRSAAAARVESLAREIEALSKRVDALSERLTSREAAPDKERPPGLSEGEDEELDRALSFAERLMRRFFDMVRQLKNDEAAERI